ncbi:MAG TPA: hypothetical protein VFK86_05135 [Bauldia sp.]|nr:hypothetical protein [Bauldia sp.]
MGSLTNFPHAPLANAPQRTRRGLRPPGIPRERLAKIGHLAELLRCAGLLRRGAIAIFSSATSVEASSSEREQMMSSTLPSIWNATSALAASRSTASSSSSLVVIAEWTPCRLLVVVVQLFSRRAPALGSRLLDKRAIDISNWLHT